MGGRKYTREEQEFIKNFAGGHSYQEILTAFNDRFQPPISVSQIKGYLANHKIVTGRTGRFKTGHTPANKGKKGICAQGVEKTWFEKGHIPVNHKPIGTVTVRNNYKRGQKYVYVKIAEPNIWRMKHVVEWEKYYGPVPKEKIIIFLDGNPLNTDISNLALIERKVHVRLNQMGMRFQDAESTTAAIRVAELVSLIGEVKRR